MLGIFVGFVYGRDNLLHSTLATHERTKTGEAVSGEGLTSPPSSLSNETPADWANNRAEERPCAIDRGRHAPLITAKQI